MIEKYILQQYDNGTFGYKGIDDCPDEFQLKEKGFGEGREIIAEQREDETRENFIIRAGISFIKNQYGSIEKYDRKVNSHGLVSDSMISQGYGLDKLINHKNYFVRAAVAEQDYGLDKLINDENEYVRAAVARRGYGLDKLINDEHYIVRRAVVQRGYGLDKLINDENEYVRRAVAWQGYSLDKLTNDEAWQVRETVAKQGYDLDKLINDKDFHVRAAVAKQGYGLDKLVYDEDFHVREEVASQGYGLDKLIDDNNQEVREATTKYLRKHGFHGFIIYEWIEQNPEKCVLKENKEKIQQKILYKKIEESEKLKLEDSNKFNGFSILTIDTHIPLITFEKIDDKYLCSINIKSNNFEFNDKTEIETKMELNKYIDFIIGELENSKEFCKYIEDIKLLKQ